MPPGPPSSRDPVRSYSTRWDEGFSHLKRFSEREGHCRVSQRYKTDDGYRLGQWTKVQRTNKTRMDPFRRQRLDALPGWVWDPISAQWEESFFRLEQFSEREGHSQVLRSYKTDEGFRLGDWVDCQRKNKGSMQPDRRRRLEALPGWQWEPFLAQWEEGFSLLKQFVEREGHCQVKRNYKTDEGFELGVWVSNQRTRMNSMEANRRQRLQQLEGWSWNPHSHLWEEGFSHLKRFSEQKGHCRVPRKYETDEGYRLGQWVGVQRSNKKGMDPLRRQRLAALPGWVWRVKSGSP
jgi:Helicase associated domain